MRQRWACLRCPDQGTGSTSDLAARKHEKQTGHATVAGYGTTDAEWVAWRQAVDATKDELAQVARKLLAEKYRRD